MERIALAPALGDRDYHELRTRAIFDLHKWDPQCYDTQAISRSALVLSPECWRELRSLAEALDRETLAAEREILTRPDLWTALGLSRRLRARLRHVGIAPEGPRVSRYDFHPVRGGWAVTEVNSDVPGGYIEASGVTELRVRLMENAVPTGDPAGALVGAFASRLPSGSVIALVHASAYTDDRQVMLYLRDRLAGAGLRGVPVAPDHLSLRGASLSLAGDAGTDHVRATFRFYPAEWTDSLADGPSVDALLGRGEALCTNPPGALLTQSKRFPLIWDLLDTALPTWRGLMPETVEPRPVLARNRANLPEGWLLKPALGRVGEGIALRGFSTPKESRSASWGAMLFPRQWAAQRRFDDVVLDDHGTRKHVCIGVYVIDGSAAGTYARISDRPVIDGHAQDIAAVIGEPVAGSARKETSRDDAAIAV